jgi:hypothetical protein
MNKIAVAITYKIPGMKWAVNSSLSFAKISFCSDSE